MRILRGAAERLRREHDARMEQAWVTAFLPHTKKPVALADLMSGARRRRRQASWEAEFAAFSAWAEGSARSA